MRVHRQGAIKKLREFLAFQALELNDAALRSAEYSKRHFRLYGLVAFVSPFVTYIDFLVANPSYNTFWIRFLAIPVCLPALYYHKLPAGLRSNFHWYFVLAATFLFPYSFGVMLAMNAALTPVGEESDILWILQYFIALRRRIAQSFGELFIIKREICISSHIQSLTEEMCPVVQP